jgi:hypothetical protein
MIALDPHQLGRRAVEGVRDPADRRLHRGVGHDLAQEAIVIARIAERSPVLCQVEGRSVQRGLLAVLAAVMTMAPERRYDYDPGRATPSTRRRAPTRSRSVEPKAAWRPRRRLPKYDGTAADLGPIKDLLG